MSTKKRKVSYISKASRRPIDKQLVCVNDSVAALTQDGVTLYTATQAKTIVGVRYSMGAFNTAAGSNQVAWCLVIVPEGTTAGNMAIGAASNLYTPEQMVMCFGTFDLCNPQVSAFPTQEQSSGETKTMRKIREGDTLQIRYYGAGTFDIFGCIQFFLKG